MSPCLQHADLERLGSRPHRPTITQMPASSKVIRAIFGQPQCQQPTPQQECCSGHHTLRTRLKQPVDDSEHYLSLADIASQHGSSSRHAADVPEHAQEMGLQQSDQASSGSQDVASADQASLPGQL